MKILTANRLSDGIAVWMTAAREWSESILHSTIARDEEAEATLSAIGSAAITANEVIDVNLIDVDLVDGVIVPRRLRERIRAGGPTISVNADEPAGQSRRAA